MQDGHYSASSPKKTGLKIIALTDPETGFTVRTALANEKHQVPSVMAFAGARFSRSALTAEELFAEINTSTKSAQEKLATIFHGYGHASVGDMAMLFAYIENVPRSLMFQFFYQTALGGGQERSSRYQDFSQAQPLTAFSLSPQAQALFENLKQTYSAALPQVTDLFTKLYQPKAGDKREKSALQARSFDTARAFLPAGTNTSGAFITSAREWARIIVQLKSSPWPDAQSLGTQLERLFAPDLQTQEALAYLPEAPDLIRHTEPERRVWQMLEALQPYIADVSLLSGGPNKQPQQVVQKVRHLANLLTPEKALLFYAVTILNPAITVGRFTDWYGSLSHYTKRRISSVILANFTHHAPLPNWAQTGGYTFEFKAALSEIIDFNRHRSFGRFTPFLETQDVSRLIRDGYTLPLYLENPKAKKLKEWFVSALDTHYEKLMKLSKTLTDPAGQRILLNLLPNAHLVRYYMTGGPKEISYMTQLRVRPGGHINYRALAYQMAEQAAKIDPLLAGLKLPKEKKPDPFSRCEFFDRS